MNMRNEQRRKGGENGTEGEIAEDPERVKERKQLFVEQPVKQENSSAGSKDCFRLILQGKGNGRLWMMGP